MLCVEDLLKLELFRLLSASRLDSIGEQVSEIHLSRGELLVREGDPPRGFFVLVEGSMGITRLSDGPEMPLMRLVPRVFEPFFATKAVGKGSGLGLDVTRRIVENRHHGTLSLQSQAGTHHFLDLSAH